MTFSQLQVFSKPQWLLMELLYALGDAGAEGASRTGAAVRARC